MDVQLGNLIDKIKKEGVETAQKQSEEIIKNAETQAVAMINKAKKEADKIVQEAKAQTQQFEKNTELAIQQAARDSELLLKSKINGLFDRVLKYDVGETMDPDFLKKMILKIIEAWGGESSVDIWVNQKDKDELEKQLFSSLKRELNNIVTLKISPDITEGFRIGLKDSNVYYDFSDQTIAEMLKQYLNPRIKEILDKGNG